jgi:hypothetical protein
MSLPHNQYEVRLGTLAMRDISLGVRVILDTTKVFKSGSPQVFRYSYNDFKCLSRMGSFWNWCVPHSPRNCRIVPIRAETAAYFQLTNPLRSQLMNFNMLVQWFQLHSNLLWRFPCHSRQISIKEVGGILLRPFGGLYHLVHLQLIENLTNL